MDLSIYKPLGQKLLESKRLSLSQWSCVLAESERTEKRPSQVLLEKELLTPSTLAVLEQALLDIPVVDIEQWGFSPETLSLLPLEKAEQYCALPLASVPNRRYEDIKGLYAGFSRHSVWYFRDETPRGLHDNSLIIAMADPFDTEIIDKISLATGRRVVPVIDLHRNLFSRDYIRQVYKSHILPRLSSEEA